MNHYTLRQPGLKPDSGDRTYLSLFPSPTACRLDDCTVQGEENYQRENESQEVKKCQEQPRDAQKTERVQHIFLHCREQPENQEEEGSKCYRHPKGNVFHGPNIALNLMAEQVSRTSRLACSRRWATPTCG